MLTNNPGIMQFTKDTEWLNDLLAYLPRFEDPGVLGTNRIEDRSMNSIFCSSKTGTLSLLKPNF